MHGSCTGTWGKGNDPTAAVWADAAPGRGINHPIPLYPGPTPPCATFWDGMEAHCPCQTPLAQTTAVRKQGRPKAQTGRRPVTGEGRGIQNLRQTPKGTFEAVTSSAPQHVTGSPWVVYAADTAAGQCTTPALWTSTPAALHPPHLGPSAPATFCRSIPTFPCTTPPSQMVLLATS